MEKQTEPKKLHRQLGFWDSVAINVGVVIGVGIFRTPGAIAAHLDSSPLILLTWVLGGLVAMLGVLCYAELASCFPETGGTYVYLKEAYGKPVGFLFGWTEFAILRAGSIAGVAYILADYLQNFIPFPDSWTKIVVIAAIQLFTLINVLGLHLGAGVQKVLTLLKIAAIGLMAVCIFSMKGFTLSSTEINWSHASGIAPALIPVLWTYGGWHQSTFMSGEFKDTKRDLPRSLITGALIVTFVYVMMNAAYLVMFTPAEMAGTKAIASDIFGQLIGPAGKIAVTVAVLISASGALNSTILTGGRIPFAVAHDYPRFSWFAKVDQKFATPLRALVLNGVWSSVLVLWGNFDQLLFFFAFANWLFFALAGLSVFRLRSRARHPETFALMGYPWVPILFVISSVLLCLITVQSSPRESLFGAALLLAGIPIYFLFREKTSFSAR